jgi:hypothetical protein
MLEIVPGFWKPLGRKTFTSALLNFCRINSKRLESPAGRETPARRRKPCGVLFFVRREKLARPLQIIQA